MLLTACAHVQNESSTAMDNPLVYENPAEFYRILQSLEKVITPDEYQQLTDAIGNLKVYDLDNVTHEDFHASMEGLSPNQIIEKAAGVCDQVGC